MNQRENVRERTGEARRLVSAEAFPQRALDLPSERFETETEERHESQVRRVSGVLKKRIAGSGFTQKAVERSLGWGDGYISQILRGAVDLKFKHFFAIAEAIEMDPAEFFREVYGSAASSPAVPPSLNSPDRGGKEFRAEVEAIVKDLLSRQRSRDR